MKARILPDGQFNELMQDIQKTSKDIIRDRVLFCLSYKAAMRVGEIAKLTWHNVTDSRGAIADNVDVPNNIAKKGNGRVIPMHPELKLALSDLWHREQRLGSPVRGKDPIVRPLRPKPSARPDYLIRNSSNGLGQYVSKLNRRAGYDLTSHSGRRTAITKMARDANNVDCSLMDVQKIAGHRHVDTTEKYVELSTNVRSLIERL